MRPSVPRCGRAPRAGQGGVTLVEMLVVLALLAITAGTLALTIGAAGWAERGPRPARALATALEQAVDTALTTDRAVLLAWDRTGWQLPGQPLQGLPPQVTLSDAAGAESGLVPITADGGPALTLVLEDQAGRRRWQVAFDGLRATVTGPGS